MKKYLLVTAMVVMALAAARTSRAAGLDIAEQSADGATAACEVVTDTGGATAQPPERSEVYSPFVDFKAKYEAWLAMVRHTHEKEQPDWMAPIVTLPATLQQQLRSDYGLSSFKGNDTDTFMGKGVEIIPTENTELLFGMPTWMTKDTAKGQIAGWADWMTIFKYRLLSSPSDAGNYVVTFLLSTSFDTGAYDITAGHDVVTPMLGFGKGFRTSIGEFDYQATVGPSIPGSGFSRFGTPVTWNNAFQYGNRFSMFGYEVPLWPEFEVSWVSYPNGLSSGQQQVYLTPGINIGRFQIGEHVFLVVGAGYQFAATSERAFDHQWLVTMRVPYF